jgi:hypothetical protein
VVDPRHLKMDRWAEEERAVRGSRTTGEACTKPHSGGKLSKVVEGCQTAVRVTYTVMRHKLPGVHGWQVVVAWFALFLVRPVPPDKSRIGQTADARHLTQPPGHWLSLSPMQLQKQPTLHDSGCKAAVEADDGTPDEARMLLDASQKVREQTCLFVVQLTRCTSLDLPARSGLKCTRGICVFHFEPHAYSAVVPTREVQ